MRGGPPRRQFGPLHLRKQRRPPAPAIASEKERTWPFALCEDPVAPGAFNVRGPDGYVVLDKPATFARASAERDRLNAAADKAQDLAPPKEADPAAGAC